MIGDTRQDGVRAIDLLQGDDECHFVLKSERSKRPEEVGGLTHPFGKPIRSAHKERACLAGIALDFAYFLREGAAVQFLAALIEHEAKATLAATQQLAAFPRRVGSLDMAGVD